MQSAKIIIEARSYKLEAKRLKANSYYKNKKINIEEKAIMLMDTLKADHQWLKYTCKILHTLPEGTIAYMLEGAKKANSPQRYFYASAKRELEKL